MSIIRICILVSVFFALPIPAAVACGGGSDCCKKEIKTDTKNCCQTDAACSDSPQQQDNCGGDCGKQGCPCPQVAFGLAGLPVEIQTCAAFPAPGIASKSVWYFLNRIPKDVFLSIWLPPKI